MLVNNAGEDAGEQLLHASISIPSNLATLLCRGWVSKGTGRNVLAGNASEHGQAVAEPAAGNTTRIPAPQLNADCEAGCTLGNA
jgi:hypothetical protein